MAIQSISRNTFEQLHPNRGMSAAWMREQVEWFAERSRFLLAYIALDVRSEEWSFVIEGRDERGEFYAIESRDQIATQTDARELLERRVNELLAAGLKVFPRGMRVS